MDEERACAATALVSLWDPGDDAGALREGAVYAVAGLQPRANARRGLELSANRSVVWQPVTNLGDRRAHGLTHSALHLHAHDRRCKTTPLWKAWQTTSSMQP